MRSKPGGAPFITARHAEQTGKSSMQVAGREGAACLGTVSTTKLDVRQVLPIIGVICALGAVEGDLAQQRHGLVVPIQYECVVGRHHPIVAAAHVLQCASLPQWID